MFSDNEIAYLASQRLARIATVSSAMQPDVSPVGFQFEGGRFIVSGVKLKPTLKYKNVSSGNTNVALVIDDLASVSPWKPRGIKIHGTAEIDEMDGREIIVIRVNTHWSWGLESDALEGGNRSIHKVEHDHN